MKGKFKMLAAMVEIAALLFLCFSGTVYGSQERLKVVVNNKEINSEAKMIDGSIYVPVRAVSESMGADVQWDAQSKTAFVSLPNTDELIPEVIKSVSPCVVGIIGNWKDDADPAYNKYAEDIVHGTGLVVKSGGEILTNAHVVKNMDRIVVVLSDGSGYEAKLKYMDEDTDLAVVKINKIGLPTAEFGEDSDIVIGKTVIAIGTPISFSLRNSASIGIISGVNRGLDSLYRLVQTDAAINPGNSGGPLVNLKGKVIGINSSKFSGVGVEGMGFSIPVSTIKYVLGHFDKYGKVRRPYLGAEFEEDWAAKVGLPSDSGLPVKEILANSPAEKQGLAEGDVIVSINGARINTIVDFDEEMKKYLPGDKVDIKFKRGGNVQSLMILLGEN